MVAWGSLAFIAANTVAALGWWFGEYEIQALQRGASIKAQSNLLNHILDVPVSYYRSVTPGETITKISSDADQLGRLASSITPSVAIQIFNLSIGVITMLLLDWRLATVTVFILPLYYITYTRCGALIKKSSQMERPSYDRCINGIREGVEGAETLKLYNKEFFKKDFMNRLNKWFLLAKKLVFRQLMLVNISGYILLLSPIVVLCIGFLMAAKGILEISVAIAFFTYMGKAFQPVRILSQMISNINSIIPMKDRILQLINIPPEDTGGNLVLDKPPSIQMTDVSFSYNAEDVLKQIGLDINQGECVAIAGRSGTGKSTIMRLLTKLYRAKTGEILLDGHKIHEYDTENLRQVVSYVDQKPYLFDFSVKDNVLLGRDVDKTYEKACNTAHVDFVDLYSEDVKIDEFSDGQRQRIGVARGIVGSPLLLILDEATSAIDSETETNIFRGLKQMQTTIIVLSHRLSTLKSTDKIFVLHDGRIIDSGTHDELVQKCPVYTQIFEEREE
jgi:ABC-type multidrug transport system fused ATPase/permease subunit